MTIRAGLLKGSTAAAAVPTPVLSIAFYCPGGPTLNNKSSVELTWTGASLSRTTEIYKNGVLHTTQGANIGGYSAGFANGTNTWYVRLVEGAAFSAPSNTVDETACPFNCPGDISPE